MSSFDLMSLNENQIRAVQWGSGSLLVLAGPGSGKTRVLTTRIAKLISESRDERYRILGLTFTTKAASEMRERLDMMIAQGRERAQLATFHSFCADILRQHGSHVGLKPDFAIITRDEDRKGLVSDVLANLERSGVSVETDGAKYLPIIDRFFAESVKPNLENSEKCEAASNSVLHRIYSEYAAMLIDSNKLDFGAILFFATTLLEAKPRIAKQIRTMYPYICVDEFQDTNLSQYRLLKLFAGDPPANLFVVADDDQIIYQWNGASPERLKALREDYSMAVVQLPANYRCPPQVIQLANNLIRNNSDRSPDKQPLQAARTDAADQCIRFRVFPTFDDEAAWVVSDILKKPLTERGDCAVLARTARILEVVASALKSNGIEAHLNVRKNEFESTPMRWLHAMLRLGNARNDVEQLRRVSKALYDLDGIHVDVEEIVAAASLLGGDYLRALCNQIDDGNARQCARDVYRVTRRTLLDRLDFQSFIAEALLWLDNLESRLEGEGGGFADYQDERSMWIELQRSVESAYGKDDLTLNILLQEIDLAPKSLLPPPHAVRCLTVHASKGMEFRHVYIVGLAEDVFPTFQSIKQGDRSPQLQEERRNCFVAITRCQETLNLTCAEQYWGWRRRPSRFLKEMGIIGTER